jgi:quinol monooxygenase YgiN
MIAATFGAGALFGWLINSHSSWKVSAALEVGVDDAAALTASSGRMRARRRQLLTAIVTSPLMLRTLLARNGQEPQRMFGLITKIRARSGAGNQLASILIKGSTSMPGCRSYVVAADGTDPDALWITEVWSSAELHKASLQLPQVREAMAAGRALIAGFGERFETAPLGGSGIADT